MQTPSPAAVATNRCSDCATRERCVIGAVPHLHASLGSALRERSYSSGEVLLREGQRASHFRIVKLGTVFICRSSAAGTMRPVAIATRGMAFGMSGFLKQPNQVSMRAGSAGRYCELAMDTVTALSRNDPAFRAKLAGALADNFGVVARWAEALGRRGAISRVAAGLRLLWDDQRAPMVAIPSHSALAELFGTTRETVARAFGALEAEGCLTRRSARRCEVNAARLAHWLDENP